MMFETVFDCKRMTLCCLGNRLSGHKMIICSKNFGGRYGPQRPPGYAYVVWSTYPGLHNGFLHDFFS